MSAIIKKYEILFILLLFIIGITVRMVLLGSAPAGLNQDEASAGYEAFALLSEGIDRNGNSWPALFVSWGSGQNVLYSYLSMPIIALLGLTVFSARLLSAIAGSITLLIFYLLAKKLRGNGFALTALFTLTVNPWHIMISRWALESNLLPLFLLLGIYFLVLSFDRPGYIFPSFFSFALSLYAYGTAFIFLPVFGTICAVYLIKHKKLREGYYVAAVILFIIIAIPVALTNVINVLGLNKIEFSGITLPMLTETRQAATTIFGGGAFLKNAACNFGDFLRLLIFQDDGLPANFVAGFGMYYFYALPLIATGVFSSLMKLKKSRKKFFPEIIILISLAAVFISALFIKININRINMAFLPLLYFNAAGLYVLICRLKKAGFIPVIAYVASFIVFITIYFTSYQDKLSKPFFEGFGDALKYADSLGASRQYITEEVNMPYIYVLFYNEIPPSEFIGTVKYSDPNAAFRNVSSFGNYVFGEYPEDKDAVYIVGKNESAAFSGGCEKISFGNYVVIIPDD